MSGLTPYVDSECRRPCRPTFAQGRPRAAAERVLVVTYDGRTLVVSGCHRCQATEGPQRAQGTLAGFDQTGNCILSDSIERVFSLDEPMEEQPLGLYIIRGDNVSVIWS
jgi:U6 snRNA-associated Sm-like protein LSm8